MTEPKTMVEAMNEFNRAIKELNRMIAADVMPVMEKLIVQWDAIFRDLYLARLRRWLPIIFAVLVLAALVGWWIT